MDSKEKYNSIISRRYSKNKISLQNDFVAIEEPLEISLKSGKKSEIVNILMRTPGDDKYLSSGFLLTEGILKVDEIKNSDFIIQNNKIELNLGKLEIPDISKLKRNFIANSSCGICGKETIDEILKLIPKHSNSIDSSVDAIIVQNICDEMRKNQKLFQKTGGVHAVGLFTNNGEIICIEEDVGRHNALDKAIGRAFVFDNLSSSVVGACLSGRASYEMVQKAAMMGIDILICIGAPTSLAIDLAVACSITLIGFVSEKGYNIYTCESRILSTIN